MYIARTHAPPLHHPRFTFFCSFVLFFLCFKMQTGVRGWQKQQYISKDTKQRRKSKAEKALTSKVSTAYAWEGRVRKSEEGG
ncbi:hypothetical protein M431DRAFT_196391 [Trichoderma harzianum CBS 226.95]|uniref:Secreted protein n=1 Tax=Trichoderma harzianum CBS 226.95 TaxID=983964 RepID=A0A2T4AUN2_TRIHA|nr:hypothetical protein M431DRAFT_196391 [Trichoderma harzianum CBS 226.95]PTB60777.1 hypothetical protein M431DRAFT_196391 [Trichoderma harzianum CBS 226.95]